MSKFFKDLFNPPPPPPKPSYGNELAEEQEQEFVLVGEGPSLCQKYVLGAGDAAIVTADQKAKILEFFTKFPPIEIFTHILKDDHFKSIMERSDQLSLYPNLEYVFGMITTNSFNLVTHHQSEEDREQRDLILSTVLSQFGRWEKELTAANPQKPWFEEIQKDRLIRLLLQNFRSDENKYEVAECVMASIFKKAEVLSPSTTEVIEREKEGGFLVLSEEDKPAKKFNVRDIIAIFDKLWSKELQQTVLALNTKPNLSKDSPSKCPHDPKTDHKLCPKCNIQDH